MKIRIDALASSMDTHKAKAKTNSEKWMAVKRANQEMMKPLMDVSLEATESCIEKIEAIQGKVEIKVAASLEGRKIKAIIGALGDRSVDQ
jgi:hypothetical protein